MLSRLQPPEPRMRVVDAFLDNPILVKHARARLRAGQVLPWVAIGVVLSACASWAGHNLSNIGDPSAVAMLLGIQIFALGFGGANQINASLGGARESGILDFHRVTPVPPAVVALGFFLGAPIREYALAAVTIPFACYSAYQIDAADRWRGLAWLAQLEVALLATVWVVQALTTLACLTRKRPRGSVVGMVVTVVILLFVSYLGSVGFYFGTQWLLTETPRLNFFGFMVPWLPWLLLYELPLFGFLSLAVARKMRAERAHAFSKPQALACMATLSLLTIGGLWKIARVIGPEPPFEPSPVDAIMLAAVYVLSFAAMLLTVTVTPDSGEYLKGVRRALRAGRRRPSAWSDAGSNRVALFLLCALALLSATAVVNVVGKPTFLEARPWFNEPRLLERANMSDSAWLELRQSLLSRPIAVAVLTAAYVGLAFQFFSLRTRRSGVTLVAVLLFAAWLVPLLAGAVIGMAPAPDQGRALTVLAVSPLPGIALSSGFGDLPGIDAIRLAALSPAIAFAFIFNYLLVITQRKLDQRLREQEKPAPQPAVAAWEPA